MTLGVYAEVADAVRQPSTSQEDESRGSVDQDYADMANEQPQETVIDIDGEIPSGKSSVRKKRGSKPTVLPPLPLRHQSLATENVSAVSGGRRVVSHHDSTEHLYDSVDESLGSRDHLYHVLESPKTGARQKDSQHLYHVLDGQTKVDIPDVGGEKALTKVGTACLPLPPKPLLGLAKQRRAQSCAITNPLPPLTQVHLQVTSGSVSSGNKNQVRPPMAIYEEVPPVKGKNRSSSDVVLPPLLPKPDVRSRTAEKGKENVYHLLEKCSSVEGASRGPNGSTEQQENEQTVEVNSDNVSQNDQRENVTGSNVCKTEETCFQSELPKLPKRTPLGKADKHKYADPASLKKGSPSLHVCEIFDDPAYCTQSHTAVSSPTSVGVCAATEKALLEEPSYAMPSVKPKDSPNKPSLDLFDDPKYNKRSVIGQAGASQTGAVLFDDPKYQPVLRQQVDIRRMPDIRRGVMRHSSSVDHFSSLIYANTNDFLNASDKKFRGGSLHNLTEKRCSLTSDFYMKVTHL